MEYIPDAMNQWMMHYRERFADIQVSQFLNRNGISEEYIFKSDRLRDDNYPCILYQGKQTPEVIVLTHGLTDSPYYMKAIAKRFYNEGVNIIMPLLPGHGLKNPKDAIKDDELDKKWKIELDRAVEVANLLGKRVSLGGFSTGGALSYNKMLREPGSVNGGLFLFSAAIDLGTKDRLGKIPFVQDILEIIEKDYKGNHTTWPNPYKYPAMSKVAGFELFQIIQENDNLEQGVVLSQPVFAAHSSHDRTVKIQGILKVLESYAKRGYAFIISEQVSHSELVLEEDIPYVNPSRNKNDHAPRANPCFDWMMQNVIHFFRHCK